MPLTMAHMGGLAHGPENSCEAIRNSIRYQPDIFEIDVRKSKNGMLFCHHGSIPFGLAFSQASRLLPFSTISKLIGPVNTLDEIMASIPSDAITYLDIKSKHINAQDILRAVNRYPAHVVWIATYSLRHLRSLRLELGDNYVYVYNRPLLFLDSFLAKAEGMVDIVQLFFWQWNDACIEKVKRRNMLAHLARWLVPKSKKYTLGRKYNNPWLTYDDLRLKQ